MEYENLKKKTLTLLHCEYWRGKLGASGQLLTEILAPEGNDLQLASGWQHRYLSSSQPTPQAIWPCLNKRTFLSAITVTNPWKPYTQNVSKAVGPKGQRRNEAFFNIDWERRFQKRSWGKTIKDWLLSHMYLALPLST